MIDSFKVRANVSKNNLLIQLRGYFMKSELELALYLAKKESEKLAKGFEVILDLDGMHTIKETNKSIYSKAKQAFYTLGAGNIRFIGAIAKIPIYKKHDLEYFAFESVGFYPN